MQDQEDKSVKTNELAEENTNKSSVDNSQSVKQQESTPKPVQETKKVAQKSKKGPKSKPSKLLNKNKMCETTQKHADFAGWYQKTLMEAEMIEYYDISGCYILRPSAYSIWEKLQDHLNSEFRKRGVKNAYFPLMVTEKALSTESSHIEGFKEEVAWLASADDEDSASEEKHESSSESSESDENEISSDSDNDVNVEGEEEKHKELRKEKDRIAIRPTSETIMYPAFAKWIRSHRDLPLTLNQWSNIVRWEFRDATPFIRSREFLWQEGHTAHATAQEAEDQALEILDLYENTYADILALPVIKGTKSQDEKFAGAKNTYTCEMIIDANGKGLQGATSHDLGQNFSKMFDIKFEDNQQNVAHVHQTSWGLTTRSIGAMIMIHGDDKGVVLPPSIAEYQVVITPILKSDYDQNKLNDYIKKITQDLEKKGIRYHIDNREKYSVKRKFDDWEAKGVPIRLEIGPNEVENQTAIVAVRFNGEKGDIPIDNLKTFLPRQLKWIQQAMLKNATKRMEKNTRQVTTWNSFLSNIKKNNTVQVPWCGNEECSDNIKESSAANIKKADLRRLKKEVSPEEFKNLQTKPYAGAKVL